MSENDRLRRLQGPMVLVRFCAYQDSAAGRWCNQDRVGVSPLRDAATYYVLIQPV